MTLQTIEILKIDPTHLNIDINQKIALQILTNKKFHTYLEEKKKPQ